MKIIHQRFIPFGSNMLAINLFGVLFVKGYCSERTINHEKIHTAQMRPLLYLPFYIIYVMEWLVRTVQYRALYKGYLNISFEREAYCNDRNFDYLRTRRPFAWVKYLKRP